MVENNNNEKTWLQKLFTEKVLNDISDAVKKFHKELREKYPPYIIDQLLY